MVGPRHRLRLDLTLDEEEVRFFVNRNAKLRSDRFSSDGSRSKFGWFGIGVRAATKTMSSRSTRCVFVGGLAIMDHSDRGIERLMGSAGLPVAELTRQRLSIAIRIRAAGIAFTAARRNRRLLQAANPVEHTSLTTTRYLAGVACFAQLLAISAAQPASWSATFLSGDVSFLRMFAAFASARAERPLLFLMNNHGRFADGSLPFESAMLFAWNSEDARAFATRPQRFCLLPRERRQRVLRTDGPMDVGLVLQNYADLDLVQEFTEQIARHPRVRSVLVRPHPGDNRPRPPESSAGTVRFARADESLEDFSERVDFAIAQPSSAIDHLVVLGVPCFGTGRLYSPAIPWGQLQGSPNFRASIPELPESIDEAIQTVVAQAIDGTRRHEDQPHGSDVIASELVSHQSALDFVRGFS